MAGSGPATCTVLATTGTYTYLGPSDDMLRVGGEWVAPAEVEATLIAHASVLEVAIVGELDDRGVVRPVAFVVADRAPPSTGPTSSSLPAPAGRLQAAPRFEVMSELPKTATGKIQRFKLRQPA